ncbi:hypothetical protein ACKKBG_A26405 [Auxenochlorella protothecoides x Auxenochlorella symbiontica]
MIFYRTTFSQAPTGVTAVPRPARLQCVQASAFQARRRPAGAEKKPEAPPVSDKRQSKPPPVDRRRIGKDAPNAPSGLQRLNKAISTAGVCSRRAADELIFEGHVKINGVAVHEPGTRVDLGKDKVIVKGKALTPQIASRRFYFAINKPKGYICSSLATAPNPRPERLVTSLLDPWLREWRARAPAAVLPPRFFTVGRLDAQSVGLIFVTNDGEWAQRVMHPSSNLTKEYCVTLESRPRLPDLQRLAAGAAMEDGTWVTPVSVTLDDSVASKPNRVRIVVAEGRNREVRNLVAAAGLTLRTLRRTRIGGYRLDPGVPFGAVRELSVRDTRRVLDRGAQDRA